MTFQELHNHIIDAEIEYIKTSEKSCFLCRHVIITKTKHGLKLDCRITGECVPNYNKFEHVTESEYVNKVKRHN